MEDFRAPMSIGHRLALLGGRMRARLSPPLIVTPVELTNFLESRAALIAQKCAIDYCRGKTGLASHALFTEEPFLKALDVCRWETFATALGDLSIVAEGQLRRQAAGEQHTRLRKALFDLYSTVLTRTLAPAHRRDGWSDVLTAFAARIETECVGEPKGALDVADNTAKRLFETLPIHASLRALDEEIVYGAVRFRMIAVAQEMQKRMHGADLVSRLTAAGVSTQHTRT